MVERFGNQAASSARRSPQDGPGDGASSPASPIARTEAARSDRSAIPILNRDAALRRMGGDAKLYQKLVRCFLEDAPGLVEQMRVGLRDNDSESLTRAAHSLKGLAANFDAHVAVAAAARVEEIGNSESLSAADSALAGLEIQVNKLSEALRDNDV